MSRAKAQVAVRLPELWCCGTPPARPPLVPLRALALRVQVRRQPGELACHQPCVRRRREGQLQVGESTAALIAISCFISESRERERERGRELGSEIERESAPVITLLMFTRREVE